MRIKFSQEWHCVQMLFLPKQKENWMSISLRKTYSRSQTALLMFILSKHLAKSPMFSGVMLLKRGNMKAAQLHNHQWLTLDHLLHYLSAVFKCSINIHLAASWEKVMASYQNITVIMAIAVYVYNLKLDCGTK